MVNRVNIIHEIIRDLKSKNKQRINRGTRRIAVLFADVNKIHEKKRPSPKPLVDKLLRKLLHLTSDEDWETRYAAMRGLRVIPLLALDRETLSKVIPKICQGIMDEDGRVRWAAVQTLDRFRILMPNDLYLETYLKLQGTHAQLTGGVRRSIGQALEKMDSPHLRTLLKAMEYRRTGAYTEEEAENLAPEEVRRALRGIIDEVRESTLRSRLKMRRAPINPDTTLREALSGYNKNALEGMGKSLDIPPPITGLNKGELVEKISSHLCNPERLEEVVWGLSQEERLALLDLLLKKGVMPWEEFIEKHGDDMMEPIYWGWHPPKTAVGRLKARGLLMEGSYQGRSWIQIPHDLRPLLVAVQRRSEET